MLVSKETSGIPNSSSIFHRLERPAERKVFLKPKSTFMNILSFFMVCFRSHRSFWMTSWAERDPLNSLSRVSNVSQGTAS